MVKPFTLLAALSLSACVHRPTVVGEPASGRLVLVRIDDTSKYVIDAGSETCALVYADMTMNAQPGAPTIMAVPCETLARNVPEAAKAITWLAPRGAAAEDAPPAP